MTFPSEISYPDSGDWSSFFYNYETSVTSEDVGGFLKFIGRSVTEELQGG